MIARFTIFFLTVILALSLWLNYQLNNEVKAYKQINVILSGWILEPVVRFKRSGDDVHLALNPNTPAETYWTFQNACGLKL